MIVTLITLIDDQLTVAESPLSIVPGETLISTAGSLVDWELDVKGI